MFGKKTGTTKEHVSQRTDLVVHTIPEMFYGGKNPEIYANQIHTVSNTHVKPQTATMSTHIQTHHVRLFVGIGILVLVLISGISWYYLRGYLAAQQTAPLIEKIKETPVAPVVVTTPVVIPTTTVTTPSSTDSTPSSTVLQSGLDISFVFPTFGLFDTADLDVDGLTDIEEELYGTDPGIWDTDSDGYYDGLEIQYLFSPVKFTPAKIIAESSVREYVHPKFGYRFYYPSAWQVATVDTGGEQVLISAQSGEYIEIIRSSRMINENFVSWYARVIGSTARYTDFNAEQNRFAFEYYRRPDWLAGFFESPEAIYTVIYHTGNNQDVVYRRSMSLVMQSFVPFGSAAPLPEQDTLPTTTTTTTTTTTVR